MDHGKQEGSVCLHLNGYPLVGFSGGPAHGGSNMNMFHASHFGIGVRLESGGSYLYCRCVLISAKHYYVVAKAEIRSTLSL